MNLQLNTRLSNIESNVSKLTSIETKLASVCADVTTLKDAGKTFEDKIQECDEFPQFVSDTVDNSTDNKKMNKRNYDSLRKEMNPWEQKF